MTTKLTLTMDKNIIEMAKEYASGKGRSLSELVENYFKMLIDNQKGKVSTKQSSSVKKLKGILKTEEGFDYKKALEEELLKKYYE